MRSALRAHHVAACAPQGTVGASEHPVRCLKDAVELLQAGETRKTRAATNMNQRSSRAHTVRALPLPLLLLTARS